MKEKLLKVAKIAAGLGFAAIAAETVSIGANAAFDDIDYVKDSITNKLNPEPPKKKGLFGKDKKGGK